MQDFISESNSKKMRYFNARQTFLNEIKNPKKIDNIQLPNNFEMLQYGPDFCKLFYDDAKKLGVSMIEYLSKNPIKRGKDRIENFRIYIEKTLVDEPVHSAVNIYAIFGNINLIREYSGDDSYTRAYKSRYLITMENYEDLIKSLNPKHRWFT